MRGGLPQSLDAMKERLCRHIETVTHRAMRTPRDFEFLRSRIYARTHQLVSSTTLKRLWGYLEGDVNTRTSTLDILSQFLGYQSWQHYQQQAEQSPAQQSDLIMTERLTVDEQLDEGDRLRLTWLPDRVCDIEYLGDLRFRVVRSEQTRLQAGDTFKCAVMIAGEPLYLDALKQGDKPEVAYVCGRTDGVRFEYLVPAAEEGEGSEAE